ncbi:hypothetical protein [Oryza sativa Japonica Group]|uniref:Uncharacterized protein n=1 Tax=Oryza sativa subsp. japonica TaxID=39947 RepID=Q5ZDR7_ORYSJ|nr:hypothetical protein [Oryza sativa Japonica Group]
MLEAGRVLFKNLATDFEDRLYSVPLDDVRRPLAPSMALQINDEGHRPLGQGIGGGGRDVCAGGGTTPSIGEVKAAAAK